MLLLLHLLEDLLLILLKLMELLKDLLLELLLLDRENICYSLS